MLTEFKPSSTPGLPAIPRHGGNGSPWIWDEDADREAVRAWDAAGRPAKKKPKGMGAFYSRTTTFVDALGDKSALSDWRVRKALEGVSLRGNLLDEFREIPDLEAPEGKQAAKAVAEKAMQVAGAGRKAAFGDAFHSLTEDHDNGLDPGFIPEDHEADFDAYVQATSEIRMLSVEQFGVHDGYKVAGTMDRTGILPERWCDRLGIHPDTPVVLDTKTGSVDFDRGKIAMQMAFYARMKGYDPHTFERMPLLKDWPTPSIDWAIIVHTPFGQGRCDLIPVDISRGWEAVALSSQVREHRSFWNRKESKAEPLISVSVK